MRKDERKRKLFAQYGVETTTMTAAPRASEEYALCFLSTGGDFNWGICVSRRGSTGGRRGERIMEKCVRRDRWREEEKNEKRLREDTSSQE